MASDLDGVEPQNPGCEVQCSTPKPLTQALNKIAYHKYWAVLEAPTVCTNGGFHEHYTGIFTHRSVPENCHLATRVQ